MTGTDRAIPAADLSTLTEKQREVLSRLARRQSYKSIASEMGISQSRVNQHVRVLKDRLGVNDPAGLVALWLSLSGEQPSTNGAWRKRQLPPEDDGGHEGSTADAAMLTFRDAGAMQLPAPWQTPEFDRVGPGFLDGPGGTAKRVGFIIAVAIGFPVAVVVTLSAMMALTQLLRSLL